MTKVFVRGCGAVSPAGWGVAPLRKALELGKPIPTNNLARPGWTEPLRVRAVPTALPRPNFFTHARLRRTSPIAQQAVGAALEALGADATKVVDGSSLRLGIIVCEMSGCVNYSRRFYDEVLKDPATASPLVFPETVFNSPASHLGALLGTTAINYTLVGDPGTFLQGIALGADWLLSERVDACLVAGVEEMDWLTTDAFRLFDGHAILSSGAGALYLSRGTEETPAVELCSVTQAHLFSKRQSRAQAARRAREELGGNGMDQLLCDGLQALPNIDAAEETAWRDWTGPRLSPKRVLGEGLMAAAAWQCVAAVDALRRGANAGATVSVVGCNQQAIAATFKSFTPG